MIQPIFNQSYYTFLKLKPQVIILFINAAIIIKISALSGSIILQFLSKQEGQSLPMKLIVVPESPFYN